MSEWEQELRAVVALGDSGAERHEIRGAVEDLDADDIREALEELDRLRQRAETAEAELDAQREVLIDSAQWHGYSEVAAAIENGTPLTSLRARPLRDALAALDAALTDDKRCWSLVLPGPLYERAREQMGLSPTGPAASDCFVWDNRVIVERQTPGTETFADEATIDLNVDATERLLRAAGLRDEPLRFEAAPLERPLPGTGTLETATGAALDALATRFSLHRHTGEADEAFRQRVIDEVPMLVTFPGPGQRIVTGYARRVARPPALPPPALPGADAEVRYPRPRPRVEPLPPSASARIVLPERATPADTHRLAHTLPIELRDLYDPCPECNPDGQRGTCGDFGCDLCTFGRCALCDGSGWVAVPPEPRDDGDPKDQDAHDLSVDWCDSQEAGDDED